jgi:hypothetical protein
MSNSLTASSPTYWSKNAGRKFYKTVVFRAISNFAEESKVSDDGRIVDRPYRSDVVAEEYSKGTALSAQDLTYTSDQLTIDQFYSLLMYVDDIDKIQNKYDTVRLWSEEAGERIAIKFDAHVLYSGAINATNTVDASNLGGTAGEGISLSTSNVLNVFGEINEYLDSENIPQDERYAVITPLFKNKLWQYIAGKESLLGDKTGEKGNIGSYGSLKLYVSNNDTGEARWTPANNPSDGDTITIEGITFTFKATPGTTAGAIDIGSDTAHTIDNLVALINNGGVGDDTNNVSVSTANQRAIQNWVAVDGATYILVYVKGTPSLTVTGSESGDTWDAKYVVQDILAGRKKAIDTAIQTKGVMGIIDVKQASTVANGKRGTNIMPLLSAGTHVYNVGKSELVRVKIRTDS